MSNQPPDSPHYDHLREYLELLISSITDYAFVLCDAESLITGWNIGAERIFGYTAVEVLGLPAAVLFTPEDRQRNAPALEIETARRTGRADDERWHLRKDGSRFWGSGILTLLKTDTGEPRGFAKIMRDLTQRKQAEEVLQGRADHATAELDRSQDQLRALAAGLMNAQEEERRRIARELHDDLGQQLAMLAAELIELRQNPGLSNVIDSSLDGLLERLTRISNEVRSVSHRLHPSILEHFGLEPALRMLVEEFDETYGLAVHLSCRTLLDPVSLAAGTVIYRIAQEGLRNIVTHASGAHVIVRLSGTGNSVRLEIQDDGPGFNADANRTGLGLVSMHERAKLVGGTVEICTEVGSGTTVAVTVPLSAIQKAATATGEDAA